MGRGYFPLDKYHTDGKKLKEASKLIQEVIDSFYDYIGIDGQSDNTDDGGSLALLKEAKRLLLEEVEE